MYRKIPAPESFFEQSWSPESWKFIQNEILAQMVFCEFCYIFKNIFLF